MIQERCKWDVCTCNRLVSEMELFFMVWMWQVAGFRMRWCVEAGGVGTKLRPRASTSISIGYGCLEERFLAALFLKCVCSSWNI